MNERYEFVKKSTFYLLFLVLIIFGLSEAKNFLSPLFLAILFSYLLFPIANFLEQHGIARILANLVAIIIGLFVLIAIIYLFSKQITVFLQDFSQMEKQALQNIDSLQKSISSAFGIPVENLEDQLKKNVSDLLRISGNFFKSVFSATTSTLVRIGLMPVYVFFMLYYRTKFHAFILKSVSEKEQPKTIKILDEVNLVAKKYMTGVFTVVLILSVLNSIGLSIIGIKYPILLGVLSAVFNFIPYFGTLIGGIFPLLFSILVMDSLSYTLWVVVYFLIIQFVENNILTPNITGGFVRLNPFITILSLILGSMIWGVVGMFLIVPFIAMFRIFCEHVSFFKPIAFLLSDRGTEEHSITWEKIKKLFKKDG